MKKLAAILCMITCIFGLAACGSDETLTEYEQWKVDYAESLAEELVQYVLTEEFTDDLTQFVSTQILNTNVIIDISDYTAQEVQNIMGNQVGISVDGNAFLAALESFKSAGETIGDITGTSGASAKIDGSQIIVEVNVTGTKKDATAELILSNDMFFTLESAALNPKATMGDLMVRAALNTLIGMGTVFAVLILISALISCFKLIPKMQAAMAKKKQPKEENSGVDNAVAQIVEQEATVEETDDLELVAVIAAAIAASEGAVTTDGFVVRSIIRR